MWRGCPPVHTSHTACSYPVNTSRCSSQRWNSFQPVAGALPSKIVAEATHSRELSHCCACFSGRSVARQLPQRCRRKIVARSLFDPPPFDPAKLTVIYLPTATDSVPAPPAPRRYTLTHNDITGALHLSIGHTFNLPQISNFYTRLLRDEVIAEWKHEASASLHIYCHVSGEERWLAPPILREYIFRREIPLVLSTFLHAEQPLLTAYPHLQGAHVVVHFQSHLKDLNSTESWGVLGDKLTWQQIPPSILRRLWLAFLGVPVDLTLSPRRSGRGALAAQPLLQQGIQCQPALPPQLTTAGQSEQQQQRRRVSQGKAPPLPQPPSGSLPEQQQHVSNVSNVTAAARPAEQAASSQAAQLLGQGAAAWGTSLDSHGAAAFASAQSQPSSNGTASMQGSERSHMQEPLGRDSGAAAPLGPLQDRVLASSSANGSCIANGTSALRAAAVVDRGVADSSCPVNTRQPPLAMDRQGDGRVQWAKQEVPDVVVVAVVGRLPAKQELCADLLGEAGMEGGMAEQARQILGPPLAMHGAHSRR